MKAFFSKIWTWILAHKIIAIVVASVLVVGTTLAMVLPIALHEHSYATEWSSDADNHWHDATCKHEEEKSDLAEHTYANACDTTCDVCGYTRTVGAHTYDNACDVSCNVCGAERTVGAHTYDNACDTSCNVCGATRTVTHAHGTTLTEGDTTHYYACSVCGDKKDEAAHVFDKTVASSEYLKDAATATTKAQYYKSCVCGKASATEYFETAKTAGTLANIQDLSKTYDKVELANPTYETNSDGAVTIEWYQGDTKLDAKPVNAGTYKVKVIIAESVTYAGISAEKEFTIAKKTLNYIELTKVYDGKGFIAYALGTEHGVVAGDSVLITCDEELDYYAGSYYFIDKTDDISITDAGIDRAFLSGTNAGNYQFANQSVIGLDGYEMGGMLTVTKRPVWAEDVIFTYSGDNNWTGEKSPETIAFENVVAGETIDSSFVRWTFNGSGVNANLESVDFVNEDDERANYFIDVTKCNADIEPRKLQFPSTFEKSYDATDVFTVLFNGDNGAVTGENVIATIKVESTRPCENPADGFEYYNVVDAGTYTHVDSSIIDVSFRYAGTTDATENYDFDDDFYINGAEFTATITKVAINLPLNFTVDYSGTTEFVTALEGINLENGGREKVTVKFTAKDSSSVTIKNAGTYNLFKDLQVTYINPNYEYNNNYDPSYSRTLTVNKKKLSNLNLQITDEVFKNGEVYLNSDNGVFNGDKVYITWSESGHANTAGWIERGSDLIAPHTGMALQGKAQITLNGSDVNNYELVLENGSYGRMEYSPFCKPDIYGVCACGNLHDGTDFDTAFIIGCREAYSNTFNLSVGDSIYFKVMGEEGEMNDFFFKTEEGSAGKFDAKYYGLTDILTPYHTESNLTEIYRDVNCTSDEYIVITCVTAGEFTVTVER